LFFDWNIYFLLLNRYCECKIVEGLVDVNDVLITGYSYSGVSQNLHMANAKTFQHGLDYNPTVFLNLPGIDSSVNDFNAVSRRI
jgi:hypothetical protein